MKRHIVVGITVLFCAIGVSQAQDHVARRVNIVDRTTGRSVSFEAGRTAVEMVVRWPSALPTLNQILTVPTESNYTANTQWADPAGAGAVTTFVVKAADQSRGPAAGYVDVTDLSVPVVANRLYEFNAWVRADRTAGTDNMNVQFTVPAGTTMSYYVIENDGAANDRGNFTEASDAVLPITGTTKEFELRGTILTAGTAGNIQMRFQRIAGGATVRIRANSYMRATSLP